MNIKKQLCTLISAALMISFAGTVNVSAAINEDLSIMSNSSYQSLPNSVDLSTSPCFPPIESQGNTVGSCVAFSTTYYQYSYQVNKLNNVTSVEDRKIYSPTWTYSLANNGQNKGVTHSNAYDVLKELGCVTTDVMPISDNYQIWLRGNEEEKIEALKTRLISYKMLNIPNNQNISSPSNLTTRNIPLSDVKSKLNDGYVLSVSSEGFFDSANVNGECIAFRCHEGGDTHSLTIVGYDNYLEYDVNGNGTIENCEKGAFKVANSWGTNFNQNGIFSNDGYFWIMYDALNLTSTNTENNWESSYTTTRYPAFSKSLVENDNNIFYYIEVGHKDVKLIGEIKITTPKKYSLELHKNVNQSNTASTRTSPIVNPYKGENPRSSYYNGIILFDYTDLISSDNYYNGYYYHAILSNFQPDEEGYYSRFRLLDDKGNIVSDYESDNSAQANSVRKYKKLSLHLGDVDYDGLLTESDAQNIIQIILKNITPSNLQYKLADYNQDGKVDISDVLSIRDTLSSTSTNIDELDIMIANYINENNISISKELVPNDLADMLI